MRAYYNECAPYPAQWLRNLAEVGHLPPGDVDERSI
jgi:DNA (cytosine-5)-methyltransferase 1